jgi:hypothetical protein
MKLLTDYFDLQEQIYQYFGYREDWLVIPLQDCCQYWWRVVGSPVNELQIAKTEQDLVSQTGSFRTAEIFRHRHISKSLYRTNRYTMVVVDTHQDGNKFLRILDNTKERPHNDPNHT